MRYFLQLSYNGKNYSGWQRQENAVSVQEILEDNLSKILVEKVEITGCGRTDAGVHAYEYFAHFESELQPSHNVDLGILYLVNNRFQLDIAAGTALVNPENAQFVTAGFSYRFGQ